MQLWIGFTAVEQMQYGSSPAMRRLLKCYDFIHESMTLCRWPLAKLSPATFRWVFERHWKYAGWRTIWHSNLDILNLRLGMPSRNIFLCRMPKNWCLENLDFLSRSQKLKSNILEFLLNFHVQIQEPYETIPCIKCNSEVFVGYFDIPLFNFSRKKTSIGGVRRWGLWYGSNMPPDTIRITSPMHTPYSATEWFSLYT